MEWVIVDDSERGKSVEHLLPNKNSRVKYNINYIRLEEKHTIGAKANIAVENSKNSIIVCMDDDDYYYPDSIKNRVELLGNFIEIVILNVFAALHLPRLKLTNTYQ